MTNRETKIGLLVGLGFVIVVGILLSDHLSAATEPPAAPLRLAGDSVRTSLGETTVVDLGGTVRIPAGQGPAQPLLTPRELASREATARQAAAARAARPNLAAMSQGEATDDGVPRGLRDLARRGGEEVVPVDPRPAPDGGAPAGDGQPRTSQVARRSESYKAEPGDTLGTIAGKLLGANTKANRDLVVAANPALQANPNRIVVGHAYTAPAAGGPTVRAAVLPTPPHAPPTATAVAVTEHYRHGRRSSAD